MRFKTKNEAFRTFTRMMEHIYDTMKERNVKNLDLLSNFAGIKNSS
jgi:hypothetical protein